MTITVDHPAFRTALAGIDQAADRLDRSRHRIATDVDALLDGGWSGAAADAFGGCWEDWVRGADAVRDGLVALHTLLAAVHRDLDATDAGSALALDRVAGALGGAGR